jgi:hypothetical protein
MLTDEQADLIECRFPGCSGEQVLRRQAVRILARAGGTMLRASLLRLMGQPDDGCHGWLWNPVFSRDGNLIRLAAWFCRMLGLPDPDPFASIRAAVARATNLYAVGERVHGSR